MLSSEFESLQPHHFRIVHLSSNIKACFLAGFFVFGIYEYTYTSQIVLALIELPLKQTISQRHKMTGLNDE